VAEKRGRKTRKKELSSGDLIELESGRRDIREAKKMEGGVLQKRRGGKVATGCYGRNMTRACLSAKVGTKKLPEVARKRSIWSVNSLQKTLRGGGERPLI